MISGMQKEEWQRDFDESSEDWIIVGKVNDPAMAEYVKETFKSYDIPVVIFSESGFFGQAGLNLPSFYSKNIGQFRIHIRKEDTEEAVEILNMILGDSWVKTDNNESN